MTTSQQLHLYEVLSIRPPSAAKPAQNGKQARVEKPDMLLSYFDWLCSAKIGPREQAWSETARPRLA